MPYCSIDIIGIWIKFSKFWPILLENLTISERKSDLNIFLAEWKYHISYIFNINSWIGTLYPKINSKFKSKPQSAKFWKNNIHRQKTQWSHREILLGLISDSLGLLWPKSDQFLAILDQKVGLSNLGNTNLTTLFTLLLFSIRHDWYILKKCRNITNHFYFFNQYPR